jgi:hypothetical protein
MKTLEIIVRRLFFSGSFALAALAVLEKIMNVFHLTLLKGYFTPIRLLEFSAIGLLFTIVMQLHQIRIALGGKTPEFSK